MASGVEDARNETPAQLPGTPAAAPKGSGACDELPCPQCGGSADRPWTGVFVVNLMTFLICGAVTPGMVPLFGERPANPSWQRGCPAIRYLP